MANLDNLMEKILNPSCRKADRMAAMDGLIAELGLGQQDRLREVLDGVCGRWKEMTDLLWIESDLAMKTTASAMIARIGAVAMQYAKLACSIIPPNILFSWIEPFLYNQFASPEQPWDETVVLFLLDILRMALSDLEGSAFKSSAPGLLTGCLSMLGSKNTPIGHFGALLEVLMQLAKVPACVRPKFRDIVDLLVGWGVCADTPENARPKLARTFQSLSFGWDIHIDLAMSLVDGMCGDLSNLVTASGAADPKQQTEFINTGICLASILESSCPYLSATTLETVPRIVELYVHGLFKYTSMDTRGDSVRPFITEICDQTKKLMFTVILKGTMLSSQRNTESAPKLQPGPVAPEGKVWARGVCVSILEAVHAKLSEAAARPLAMVAILAVHVALIAAFRAHVNVVDLEDKLHWLFGEHSMCFHLRSCRSKQVIQQVAAIYTILLSWTPGPLRRSIRDLFLRDFRQTSSVIRTGLHALPLLPPPQPLDALEEKDKIGLHKSPASSAKIDGGLTSSPAMSIGSEGQQDGQDEKDVPALTKRTLFALTLFKRMVESDSMDSDDVQRLWDVLWMESFKEGGLLRHKKLVVKAVKTLRDLFAWRQSKGVMDVSGVVLVLDYIGRLLGSSMQRGAMNLTASLLEWAGEVVEGSKFRVPLGFRLTELMLDLSRATDERLRIASGETMAVALLSCPGFPQESLVRLSQSVAENASDLALDASKIYGGLLGLLAPYALSFASFGGVFPEGAQSSWSRIALQSQSRLFRPKQLSLFLNFICETASVGAGSTSLVRDRIKAKGSRNGLHDVEWALSFLHSLPPVKMQQDARGDEGSEFPVVYTPVAVEALTSRQGVMWFVIHEAARNLVSSRFRAHGEGPSQVFAKLEEAVSEVSTKVVEGSWVDLKQTWMLLEFVSALEKHCFCGYEGSEMLASPPAGTWPFYMGNRKVFVEWFARFRPKLLFVSHKIGHHHYSAFVGMQRIHSLEAEYLNWVKVVAAETKSSSDRAEAQNQKEEAYAKILHHLSETVMQTCLSLCRLHEAFAIRGLHHHISKTFATALMMATEPHTPMSAATPVGWLRGLALQADGQFEQAILAYNEFYTFARSQATVAAQDTHLEQNHEELVLSRLMAKDFQPFARERIAECFAGTGDWRSYRSFLQVVEQQSRVTNGLWWRLRHIELSVVYDTGTLEEAVEKMGSWAQEGNFSGIDKVAELSDAITLKALIAARCASEQKSIPDGATSLSRNKTWKKLQPAVEILSQESPYSLSRHLINLHCLQCAQALSQAAQTSEPTPLPNRVLTLFGVCEDSRRCDSDRVLGVLEMMVPELSGGFSVPHALSGLTSDDMMKFIRLQRVAGQDVAKLLLLGSYVARRKGNVRLASRLLNDDTLQTVRPAWMKSLAKLENREILLRGAKDGKGKLLGQWWESSMRVAREASQETDSSKALMAISLVRLSKWLSPGIGESLLAAFRADLPVIAGTLGDRWDQVMAASRAHSVDAEHSDTNAILRARAACTATAIHVCPRLPFVWKEFGDTLHDIVQHGQDKAGSVELGDGDGRLLGVRYSIIAYCKYWQLNGKAMDSSILLRLHQMVNLHGQFLMDNELERMLMSIPASAWTSVTPQLFMQLRHSAASVRKCMLQILKGVSSVAPSSVLYGAVVKKRQAEIDGEVASEELEALLTELHVQYPHLFNDLCIMLDEMERITVLWVEQWHATLAELHLDVHRRIVTFQAEMERLKNNDVLDNEQKQAMTQQRFGTLFTPVILALEKRLKLTLAREPETSNESEFKVAFVNALAKAIARLRAPSVTDATHIQKLWSPVKNLLKDMDKELKVLKLKMQDVSPKLMNLKDTELPMPGYHMDNVTICGFGDNVLVLSTKTRPKKLEMMGSDGHKHTYLLKGREDLHLDQRLMQFVSATNSMLQLDEHTGPQGLRARDYSVTPLGGRVGLIQWVSGTISLYGIFRSWQKHHQDKAQAVNAVKGDGPDGEARKAIKAPPAAQMRPTDLYYAHLFPELNKANIPRVSSSRKDWPLDLMLRVFHSLQDHIPKRLLANELWCGSSSASAWWHRAKKYSQSTAVMSIVGFMLGLGDRHLDNVLIDKFTAEVVHIDYDVCFDKGTSFRIPEIVPFRMSQIMQVALGIGGLKGTFYQACADVLRVMRNNKDGLWMLLESVLNDPTVDWAADRHERAARKGMDLAVNLQLFESRCEEVQGSIQLPRQRLLPALEATSEACRNAAELHGYMGDLLERMQTARQKAEEAQAVLSSAASDDQELIERAKAARGRHDKYLADLRAIQGSVQQVLSHCHQWTYRHSRVLENLGDLSSPILVLPSQKWESRATTTPIDLVQHSELFQGRTVLDSAFNGGFTTANIPPEAVQNLQALDHQGGQLLSVRDELVLSVKASLQEYMAVRKHLLSEDYLSTSHHCSWMLVFQTALAATSVDAVARAQGLAPKVPSDAEVNSMWKVLTQAYGMVQSCLDKAMEPPKVTPALIRVEQDASARTSVVQKGLATDWGADALCGVLPKLIAKLLEEANEQNAETSDSAMVWHMGVDSATLWARKVFGLAQLFRLLRSSHTGKALLFGGETADESCVLPDTSTGYGWLDALEQYTSKVSLALRSFRHGALIDLTCFIEEGHSSMIKSACDRMEAYHQNMQAVCQKAWTLEDMKIEQAEFIATYDSKVTEVVQGLQEVNQMAANSMMTGVELQELATRQQMLTEHLQELQMRWEACDSVVAHLGQETEGLVQSVQAMVCDFVNEIKGIVHHKMEVENQPPFADDIHWGQMDFPMYRSFVEIFDLLESAEQELSPYMDQMGAVNPKQSSHLESSSDQRLSRFPTSLGCYTCHLEHCLWLKQLVAKGAKMRTETPEEDIGSHLDVVILKALSVRLQRVAGGLFCTELNKMLGFLQAGPHPEDATVEQCSQGGVANAKIVENGDNLLGGEGHGLGNGSAEFGDHGVAEKGVDTETADANMKSSGDSHGMQVQKILDCCWACIDAQGLYAHSALLQRSMPVWTDSMKSGQAIRLKNLAAFQWLHDDVIANGQNGGASMQYTYECFSSLSIDGLPAHLIEKNIGRSQMLGALQTALHSLREVQAGINEWNAQTTIASGALYQTAHSYFLQKGGDSEVTMQVLQGYLNHRSIWLEGAMEHADGVISLGHGLLQFEYSRTGVLWNPGEALSSQSFSDFSGWLLQLEAAAEGLKAANMDIQECQSKVTELQIMTERATVMLQATQVEDMDTSHTFSESTGVLVQSAYDAAQKLEGLFNAMEASQPPIEKDLGPLLKELASITNGHKATHDAHELVSRVLIAQSTAVEILPKLLSGCPPLVEKLQEILKPVMSDQHKQDTEVDAGALYNQAAIALVEDGLSLCSELEEIGALCLQAFSQLSETYQALDYLMAATKSIAAALQSEHGLEEDAADLDAPSEVVSRCDETLGTPVKEAPSSESSDSDEEQWIAPGASAFHDPKDPSVIAVAIEKTGFSSQPEEEPLTKTRIRPGQESGHCTDGNRQASMQDEKELPEAGTKNLPLGNIGMGRNVGGKRTKMGRQMSQEQKGYAASVSRRCLAKLEGKEKERPAGVAASVEQQLDGLVEEATDPSNLCRMYEGWTSWI